MFHWLKKKFLRKDLPLSEPKLLVWGVLQGPIEAREVQDPDYEDPAVMMVVKVSEGLKVFNAEFWFNDMIEAQVIVDHFKDSINPLELNMKEFERDR